MLSQKLNFSHDKTRNSLKVLLEIKLLWMCYWLQNSTLNAGFHVLGARSHELTVSLMKEYFHCFGDFSKTRKSSESPCRNPTLLTVTDLRYIIHWPRSKISTWFQRHLGFNKLLMFLTIFNINSRERPPLTSLPYELFNNAIFCIFLVYL